MAAPKSASVRATGMMPAQKRLMQPVSLASVYVHTASVTYL